MEKNVQKDLMVWLTHKNYANFIIQRKLDLKKDINRPDYQKVLTGKRITIPFHMANKYDIKEGDIVIVEDDNGVIKIIPVDLVKRYKGTS